MPTGYTACIGDNDATFEQYALGCARAFGALITMRDEPMDAPIPEKFEPSSYHLERVTEARKRQAELEAMTPAETESAANGAHAKALADYERYVEEKRVLKGKYDAMLLQVQNWTPPTSDHQGLKDFMVEQIYRSMSDCEVYSQPPVLQTGAEWLAQQMASVKHDIEYHSQHHGDEVKRTSGRTEWVHALRESLK